MCLSVGFWASELDCEILLNGTIVSAPNRHGPGVVVSSVCLFGGVRVETLTGEGATIKGYRLSSP